MSAAKSRAALVSVASNSALVLLKLAVGFLTGSVSIVSEAIHSANDLLAAGIALFSVRTSDKAPDEEHPYGHGKIEAVSGGIEAALIIAAAAWIVAEAIARIRHGGEVVEHLGAGTAVMAVSTIVNIFVSRHLFRVARAEGSIALEADAHHLSTDVVTSLGVAVGLAVVWVTGYQIVDPIVAIAVALFILRIGVGLTIDAVQHLLDRGLPPDELAEIEAVLRTEPDVLGSHRLRTRRSGSLRMIDLHVVMRANATVGESHAVAQRLEAEIGRRLAPAHTIIHVDPGDAPSQARSGDSG